MNRRWLRVGLLTLGIFAINVIARVVTKVGDITEQSTQDTIAYTGLGTVCLVLAVAGAWWAVRYPFPRMFFDLAAVVVAFAFLAVLVGPLVVGNSPFEGGLESVVSQILVYVGIGLVAALLGFAAMVTLGRDWKSKGLKRYEESYHRRPHKTARG